MNLDESQQKMVAAWIEEGLSLAQIQSRMASDFGISLTYMEVRFLVDDLNLKLKDQEEEDTVAKEIDKADATAGDDGFMDSDTGTPGAGGNVRVRVDQIARPGAIVSGSATFSDGKTADWMLDQYGRLGLVPAEEGYKPSEEDMITFQMELQEAVRKMGM